MILRYIEIISYTILPTASIPSLMAAYMVRGL